MSFFQRFRKIFSSSNPPTPEPPSWASFFNAEQYALFLETVAAHFTKDKRAFTMGDGVVHVENLPFASAEPGKQQLGLVNLAQNCAGNPTAEWPEIVASHFRTMEKSFGENKVLEERIDDFSRVSEFLAVRIWPEGYFDKLDRSKILHRRDLPGTVSALVFDMPSSIRNVTPEEIKGWGKSEEELFAIGLANVKENCIPNITSEDLGDDVSLTLFSDESFFVASHALLLEEHEDCLGPFGTLIGIPHRHVLLTFAIEDMRVLPAIHKMIPIIAGMERDGPGSISPMLYWYQKGDFTELPYRLDKNNINFTPPEEFVDMLKLLGEP